MAISITIWGDPVVTGTVSEFGWIYIAPSTITKLDQYAPALF